MAANYKYDLLIIGGGILGTFYAYHALVQGLRVGLIEKDRRPQRSSVRNFGQIVPSGMNRTWQRYGRKSLDIYRNIQLQFDISVRQNGSVYIASDEEEMILLEELATINRSNDYPSLLLTKSECLQRYEGLRADYCKGGLFFPEEITLEPRVAVRRIIQFLTEQRSLSYYPATLAVGVDLLGNKCVVKAADGRIFHAEKVLICNGHEVKTLFPEVYAERDLQMVKLQMLQLAPQPTQRIPGSILTGLSIRRYESFTECPSYQTIKARESKDSFARQWGIHILVKQASDGSVILGDSHEYADINAEEDLGFDVRMDINQFILEEAQKIFHFQNPSVEQTWTGLYAQQKNGDAFHHSIDPRIHIITGMGGKGMTGSAGYAFYHPFYI